MQRAARLLAHGIAGRCSAVLTTGVRNRGRDGDWRLTGTTYLWMLPIHGSAAVLSEPAHDAVRPAYASPWFAVGPGMGSRHDALDRLERRPSPQPR